MQASEREQARKRPWDGIVSEEEQQTYAAAGLGKSGGMGKRPALLIIDVQYRTTGTKRVPLHEAIKEYPTACGEVAWRSVDAIAKLADVFRRYHWPILYPYVAPKQHHDGGRLADKVPSIMSVPLQGYEFVKAIAPRSCDILLPKRHPSAFFGTPLTSYLIDLGVDTLVVTGCSTSGCVRGTVVDAFAYNYRVLVPEECVYDRSRVSHAVNLFDMASKYADVIPMDECRHRLGALWSADLPPVARM